MEPLTIQFNVREKLLLVAALSYAEANCEDMVEALCLDDGIIRSHGFPMRTPKSQEYETLLARVISL
jgi:hypothetical protein